MARYVRDFPLNGTPEQMYETVRQYLMSEGYVETQVKGENVLKKGDGWVSGPTCFKFSFYPSFMRMETWMMYAVLPGVFAGEIGTEGFVGCAVKGPWKNRIAHIEGMLLPGNPYLTASVGAIPAYTQQAAGAVTNSWNQVAAQAQAAVSDRQSAPQGGFCSNCGAPLTPGSAFCGNCGKRL